jgi:DNA-binding NarL/FixJ family response regulator
MASVERCVVAESPSEVPDGSPGEFVVLEVQSGSEGPAACLTSAEQEVLRLVERGLTNEEIAAERRRSRRTVAKQVASVLAKHRVHGRAELFALLARPPTVP